MRLINADGHINVSAPLHISVDEIKGIVLKNRAKIDKSISRLKIVARDIPTCNYGSGDIIKFKGEAYILDVQFSTNRKLRHIESDWDTKTLSMESWESSTCDVRHQQILNFYKVNLAKWLDELLTKWMPILDVTVSKVRIRRLKTRWGSCSSSGHLTFNLALAKLPYELVELVVVHELIHRLEMNHGTGFYAILSKHLPNYKELNRQLKRVSTQV
ncbi:MAG: SprT family zinc-dependent metalloprotease [Bacteroidaceae bacterium]